MGARPLRRAIQRFIEDPLADYVLGRELNPGATIVVDRREVLTGVEDESLVEIRIVEGEPPAKQAEAEKVTVPPDEPAEPEEASVEE